MLVGNDIRWVICRSCAFANLFDLSGKYEVVGGICYKLTDKKSKTQSRAQSKAKRIGINRKRGINYVRF